MDIGDALEVAPVWAGHPVGFALLTANGQQFVAFYDEERQLTLAQRALHSTSWHFTRLPVTTTWDSHRYVTMAVDRLGHLHVVGNMHNSPLVYFRAATPGDCESLQAVATMVGRDESRCTYPRFFKGPDDALVFTYRDGSSGNGAQLFNVYSEQIQSWRRLVDRPLIDGEGKRGIYVDRFRPLFRASDGYFHLCWVWRDTSDPVSTHDPSYARSANLIDWETSDGIPLQLPVTLAAAEIVESVPTDSGLINGNICVSLDASGRPIVSYHKFDAQGRTQLYNARREDAGWIVYETSEWDYRWEFGGGGTIPFAIRIGPVQIETDGELSQAYQHVRYGTGKWSLDKTTLRATGNRSELALPRGPVNQSSSILGLVKNHAEDLGKSEETDVRYVLRWETLPANRDRHRQDEVPFATTLSMCKLLGKPSYLTGVTDVPFHTKEADSIPRLH